MRKLYLIYFFALMLSYSDTAKILTVLSTPFVSHQMVFRPFILELVKRGHDVTAITSIPIAPNNENFKNLREINVYNVSISVVNELLSDKLTGAKTAFDQYNLIWGVLSSNFDLQLQSKEVRKLVADENKFDVVISEACVRQAVVFGYIYNVPVIEFSSFLSFRHTIDGSGAEKHTLLYPLPYRDNYGSKTVLGKLKELYFDFISEKIFNEHEVEENMILKKHFGRNTPTVSDIKKRYVQMMFFNVHPIWDGNRPVPPNIIYLGGLPQNSAKELPKSLKQFLDLSTDGVIYMSFGTIVHSKMFSPDMLQVFLNVFSKLKYSIIWKWNEDSIPGMSNNIRLYKWLPQSDLLKHPNIKLFITQAGLHSTDQAIAANVPILAIPMIFDQKYNAYKCEDLKIGIKIEPNELTEESFGNAIKRLIEDKSYHQNIQKLNQIMSDEPQTSMERAIWWTEYVIRYKNVSHLFAKSAQVTWHQYYEVNLVLTSVILVCSIITIAMRTLMNFAKGVRVTAKFKRA